MPKALRCHAFGGPETLMYEEIPALKPGAGQVLVSVKAAAVNFPDTLIIQGKYQYKPDFPFCPGAEISGVVAEVGAGVNSWSVGDAVFGQMPLPYGGFREEVVLEAESIFKLPGGMGFDVAAAFGAAYGTAYYALHTRGQLRPGETLLVLGAAGGVGLAAVELGKLLGATVIAAASSSQKRALCLTHGASHVIDYSTKDLRAEIKRLTGGRGVDVVLDPVGGAYAEAAIRSCTWGGRYLVVGFASGAIPTVPTNILLLKGASAVGVFWSGFAHHAPEACRQQLGELSDWVSRGMLAPRISHRYPLSRGAEALKLIAEREAQGKVILMP